MMTHMNPRFLIGPLAVGVMLAGCDRGSPRVASGDSLLSRDLTLAAASATATAPLLGDTANGRTGPLMPPKSLPTIALPAAAAPPPTASVSPVPPVPRTAPTAQPTAATPPTLPSGPLPLGTPIPFGVNYDAARGTAVAATAPTAGGTGPRELPFGTVITGRTNAQICARANRPGDRLVITTTTDTFGPDGARLPSGSQIVVEMTAPEAGSEFAFRAKSVQVDTALLPIYGTVRVEAPPVDRSIPAEGTEKKTTFGTAVKGAVLGGMLGGRKGAMIGAAGAVAAGAIADRRSHIKERCLPSGIALALVLSAPLVLNPGAK